MRLILQQFLQILSDIESKYQSYQQDGLFSLNQKALLFLVEVNFPFDKFVSLILSVWLNKPVRQMKDDIERLLIYQIHRHNIEDDTQLDFSSVLILDSVDSEQRLFSINYSKTEQPPGSFPS